MNLPQGIHQRIVLPDAELQALWDSIILDPQTKSRLHSQAVLHFTLRPKVPRNVLPLHGVILLVGEPGTGKTSLARGLADRAARSFKGTGFQLLEVEPHSLTSHAMGKTQRAVMELFSQSIAEAATTGPTIVLLDEVETLAADRSKLSFDANPVDVHRATDAVLVQLDALAEHHQNLLFVATSNFPQAIDTAFTSRCDLILQVPLPNRDACEAILTACLNGLAKAYPRMAELPKDRRFRQFVDECEGLDGRALRKTVANALALTQENAMDPERVSVSDLIEAARSARTARTVKTKR